MSYSFPGKGLKLDPVYPVTDSPERCGRTLVEQAALFLDSGIRFFQVRDKESADRELLRQLQEITSLCRSRSAGYVVNDRVDLALAARASGVHLGQTDLPVSIARRILGSRAIIGLSTHNREQFEGGLAEEVDYLAVGPIFPTHTKDTGYPALGTEFLQQIRGLCRIPLVAIGGITADNILSIRQNGADSAAVISAISCAADPAAAIQRLLETAYR